MNKKTRIYLAGPYYHIDERIRELRFKTLTQVASKLIEAGNIVLSPVTHSHPINFYLNEKFKIWEIWSEIDFTLLDSCDVIYVLCMPGLSRSRGVRDEIKRAKEQSKQIYYIKYNRKTGKIKTIKIEYYFLSKL